MPKGYHHQPRDQKCQLYTLKSSGKSANETTTILGVHISSVYRELSRKV